MVGFIKKKISSNTFGERLKEIRKKTGVSLSEIARATKVRKIYFEMLESDQLENLPPDVYVRGFLTAYGQHLNVDPKMIIKLYEKEKGIRKSIKKIKSPVVPRQKIRFPQITITPNYFAAFFVGIVLIIGATYFYREVKNFSATPRLVIVEPLGDVSIESNSVKIAGITDKENNVFINGQPVFVGENGEFTESVTLHQGLNELEVKAKNRLDKETAEKINIAAKFENQVASEDGNQKVMGESDENIPEKIVLEIRVENEPTWIAVEIDDKHTQGGTMLPGSTQIFEAEEKISITSGKANKTTIKLNGNELGKLDESSGVIRDVIFTRETELPERKEL